MLGMGDYNSCNLRASFAVSTLDPRRSLAAGIIWLVVGLAASFAVAASLWAGQVAREIVVQQHVRRLALETDQLGADLGAAINARLQAIRAVNQLVPASQVFARLTQVYPELSWIALANADGVITAGDGTIPGASNQTDAIWFAAGRRAPWIGTIESVTAAAPLRLGDFAAPLTDAAGKVTGVVSARLLWRRASGVVPRLSEMLDVQGSAQTLIVDGDGKLVSGHGTPFDRSAPEGPQFESRDDKTFLVARATVELPGIAPHWQVQLVEPKDFVYQRANALAVRIWWISICVGAVTAVIGAMGAKRLTNRLQALTRSAAAAGRNEGTRIEVPRGHDEVAQLGAAFAKVLDDLRQERSEESRYAAVVRERLQIARDLHDTLAHSMMAMLSEVRLLRKLQLQHPESMQDELARAEQVAQSGLNEARSAIAQIRVNSVRDTGLGPALSHAVERFKNRTSQDIEFAADPAAASFGDRRAEVVFRIAEEALRNIERHAGATRVSVELRSPAPGRVQLRIADDGVGFDTTLARPGHFGLVGLREQAQLIGADLDIDSAPGRGTRLSLNLRTAPEN
jgi:signal transduction histidine kinase